MVCRCTGAYSFSITALNVASHTYYKASNVIFAFASFVPQAYRTPTCETTWGIRHLQTGLLQLRISRLLSAELSARDVQARPECISAAAALSLFRLRTWFQQDEMIFHMNWLKAASGLLDFQRLLMCHISRPAFDCWRNVPRSVLLAVL